MWNTLFQATRRREINDGARRNVDLKHVPCYILYLGLVQFQYGSNVLRVVDLIRRSREYFPAAQRKRRNDFKTELIDRINSRGCYSFSVCV